VSRRDVTFPSTYILALIFLLTFAHAILMVSSAIIISVQATTIRSANLLASFVVVPVAFLLQGETFLIFWGNEDVLWFAIVGVTLLSVLLVRLGLSHFRREYLLGREIDTLNFKQIGRTFRDRFVGEAHSVFEWLLTELPLTLKQLRQPLRVIYGLAIVAGIVSYLWVVIEAPSYLHLTQERLTELRASITENPINLNTLGDRLPSAPLLFYYNARTTVVTLLLGLVSFGTMGLTVFIANIALVGGVLGGAQLVGYSPWLVFAVGILPHGIFELPAIFLATAAMLKVGAQLVTPQSEKSLGEILLLSLADWLRIFVGLVLPLLAVAALIEIYITPALIRLALPYF
ncbi:MAG TPA: stage II sporulation protein M, partial [Anaerolineales bacterium]|nr:stage II sporulation protein M [Anaerolineales bacterium]